MYAFAYLSVFTQQFWLVIIISTFILSFFLHRIFKFEQKKDNLSHSFVDIICFTLLSLCCREINAMKANCAGKMLIIIILCWGFLISCSYNAILTSELSVPKVSTPIKSFEDLLHSQEYNLILRNIGSTYDYFSTAPDNSTGTFVRFIEFFLRDIGLSQLTSSHFIRNHGAKNVKKENYWQKNCQNCVVFCQNQN